MTADEKRNAVVNAALTRKQKNKYSQDMNKRNLIESGYGDCSATIHYWYKKILNMEIGSYTEAILKSKLGKIVELQITNGVPDESKMKLGDCLLFRGKNNDRHLGVGHIEMYIGNGQCFGHGSGIGGTIKNMKDYCTKRQNTKSTTKLKNTGLICVVRFIEDDKIIKPIIDDKPSIPEIKYTYDYYIVKSGDTLSSIANKFNTTIDKLKQDNNIKNVDSIDIGQKIITAKYQLYYVVAGDNLSKISQKFLKDSNKYKDIMKWSGIKSTTLSVGQVLRIKID